MDSEMANVLLAIFEICMHSTALPDCLLRSRYRIERDWKVIIAQNFSNRIFLWDLVPAPQKALEVNKDCIRAKYAININHDMIMTVRGGNIDSESEETCICRGYRGMLISLVGNSVRRKHAMVASVCVWNMRVIHFRVGNPNLSIHKNFQIHSLHCG